MEEVEAHHAEQNVTAADEVLKELIATFRTGEQIVQYLNTLPKGVKSNDRAITLNRVLKEAKQMKNRTGCDVFDIPPTINKWTNLTESTQTAIMSFIGNLTLDNNDDKEYFYAVTGALLGRKKEILQVQKEIVTGVNIINRKALLAHVIIDPRARDLLEELHAGIDRSDIVPVMTDAGVKEWKRNLITRICAAGMRLL